MAEQLYKVLNTGRSSIYGKGLWVPGRWRSARLPLVPCKRGLHVCTPAQLPDWLGPAIWEVEVAGERIDEPDKIVVQRARITRQVETWTARTARLYAADCAERVLPLFEAEHPHDDRPRRAIAIARACANGEATGAELAAAGAAAWDAAWAAARAAARAAAWDAAWAAARDAERQWQAELLGQYLRGGVW